MTLKLITAPATEPVTASEAKSHLRVDTTADDTLIGTLITAARQHVENHLRRALITQTWELVMDAFPAGDVIRLPRPPLVSVTSIKYTDVAGSESTFSSAAYVVDTDSTKGRVVLKSGESWPSDTLAAANGVRVRYVAGYGSAAAVPNPIRQAVLLLIGTLYENRESVLVAQGVTVAQLPFGVEALLMPYRIFGW
jgi:uncharacterized phiE125 gp8 family phage protein